MNYLHTSLRNKRWVAGFLICGASLVFPFLQACEEAGTGTIETASLPAFVRSIQVSPDSVSLNTITPSGGRYSISLDVFSLIDNAGGGVQDATATLTAEAGGDPIAEVRLAPQANSAGTTPYSGRLQFSVTRSQVGYYRVRVQAKDERNVSSNSVDRRIAIWRTNGPPVLSNLSAPDTVTLPTGGSLPIPMSIRATDPEGTDDIQEVYFRSLDSSDPSAKFFLLDNGNSQNGDQTADDGIYSIIVGLQDGPNVRRTFRFAFQAIDRLGDTSTTQIHYLTVR